MRKLLLLLVAACVVAVVAVGCDGGDDKKRPGTLVLPGDSVYPESIAVDLEGNLYIGSLIHGEVLKFSPKSDSPTYFISTSSGLVPGVAGVVVDPAGENLYLCVATAAAPETVKSFNLATGALVATYTFPVAPFCNDLAFDGSGNLYVADSYGKIWKRPATGTVMMLWSSGGRIAPVGTSGLAAFGADGIAWDGGTGLFVNNLGAATIVRIPILGNGSAGVATPVHVTPALIGPDGMRLDGANSLLVADNVVGTLVRVNVTGTTGAATVVQAGFQGPTSVVRAPDGLWVTEGQLGHLFGFIPGPPELPFKATRVDE